MSRLSDEVKVDEHRRTITIFGIEYADEIFRYLGLGPIGSVLRIIKREDGIVTLKRLRDEDSA